MRGKKAKTIRKIVGYSVTKDRPELPTKTTNQVFAGLGGQNIHLSIKGWNSMVFGTCRLPKGHPRRNYQFFKKRYHMVPMASLYKRVSMSREVLDGLQAQAAG